VRPPVDLPELTFRPVDEASWADMGALFEAPGGPKHCWCMVWRTTAEERKQRSGAERKAHLEKRVAAGVPIGILAYRDRRPVGWCSVAPRPTYRTLGGVDAAGDDPERVWSIVCFFVPRAERGHGLIHDLIGAAVTHAAARGATVVEAYPVPRDAPSYRFMGFVDTFRAEGFTEVGRAGIRRVVMRKSVSG
jgi:GNAT superfamily N-acetyltransferase